MKTVRLSADNTVREVIPAYGLPVERWYGAAFAENCVEAPDEADQDWRYDPDTGDWSPPGEGGDDDGEHS